MCLDQPRTASTNAMMESEPLVDPNWMCVMSLPVMTCVLYTPTSAATATTKRKAHTTHLPIMQLMEQLLVFFDIKAIQKEGKE